MRINMSDFERQLEIPNEGPKTVAGMALNISRKVLACGLAYLMIPLGIGDLYAQGVPQPTAQGQYDQAPPPPDQDYDQGPPPQAYNPLSPEQLDQLVAPIALYPDALVAQILAASTFPSQVADADHFVEANAGAPPDQLGAMADQMNWDPSVKALVAFPRVLNNMDRNLDWTSQLGNAYYNQPQDVMSAVQDMRARAYESGNLRSGQYYSVQYVPGDIVIAPVNPEVVYVPWYNPWVVYGAPISPWGGYYVAPRPVGLYFAAGVAIGFGVGIAIVHWNHWGWGWHNWGMGWHERTVVYQRNVYISNSVHVVNHGYYGHFDRNPQARVYNHTMYARNITRINNITRVNNVNRVNNINRVNNVNRENNFNRNNNFNRTNNNVRPNSNIRQNNNFNYRQENNARPNNNVRPNNTFNRPNDTFNRPNNGYRPNENMNRPNNAQPNFNRPNNNYRPEARPNFSQPNNNYRPESRPNNNFNRPNNNYRPQARPNNYRPNNARPNVSRPESHPQGHPESRPSGGHENRGHGR